MERITPEYAVKRATWFVSLPSLFILIGGIASGLILMSIETQYALVCLLIGVLAGICLGWLYWGYAVVQWKLWAYSKVTDITALKIMAVNANITYADGHFLNKTEIKSAAIVEELKQVEAEAYNRLQQEALEDDAGIEEKYPVYFHQSGIYLYPVLAVLFFAGGIWAWIEPSFDDTGKGTIAKYLMFPMVIWLVYESYKRYKLRKQPLILFTDFGLYLYKAGEKFYPWNEVHDMRIARAGKTPYVYFTTADGEIDQEYDFNIPQSKMYYLYRVYRNRFIKNNPALFSEVHKDLKED